jgi:hypothetical protein
MTSEQDKLLACWCRKSIDVTAKLVLYAAYGIDTLALMIVVCLASVWAYENFYSPTVSLFNGIVSLVSLIIVFVPWYVWLVVGVAVAILGYSYAWCVAREFTDEDWYAEDFMLFYALLFPIMIIPFAIEAIYRPDNMSAKSFTTTMVWVFPSAYLHYRKRIKGEKK